MITIRLSIDKRIIYCVRNLRHAYLAWTKQSFIVQTPKFI
nr:MAG TPA: hypothetical protein [Caudoviricetes sp.]